MNRTLGMAFVLAMLLACAPASAFAKNEVNLHQSTGGNVTAQNEEADSAKKKSVAPGTGTEERQTCAGDPDALACEPGQTRRCVSGVWTCVDIPSRPQ
ncbi:MAG: hypothetical protein ACT4OG_09110 [Alphaproteobacteria bacterium]